MFKNFRDTSIVLSLPKYLYRGTGYIVKVFDDMYKDSQTYLWTEKLKGAIKVSYQYSCWAAITEIKEEQDAIVLTDSAFIQYIKNLWQKYKRKSNSFSNTSIFINLSDKAKKKIYLLRIKSIGIIAIFAIIANTCLLFISKKFISFWDGAVRFIILFLAMACLSLEADWKILKENSIFLRSFSRHREK